MCRVLGVSGGQTEGCSPHLGLACLSHRHSASVLSGSLSCCTEGAQARTMDLERQGEICRHIHLSPRSQNALMPLLSTGGAWLYSRIVWFPWISRGAHGQYRHHQTGIPCVWTPGLCEFRLFTPLPSGFSWFTSRLHSSVFGFVLFFFRADVLRL